MDASTQRPPDPLAAWLAATEGAATAQAGGEDTGPPSGRTPRSVRPRLIMIAAVPWLAVVVVGAAAFHRATPTAPPVPTVPAVQTPDAATASPSGILPASGAVDGRLAAAAVLTLRLALPDEQYLDTAVAEDLDAVDGAVVVTVAAVVLDRVDGQWGGPRDVRFAVPLSVGQSEPVALGAPWVLSHSPLKEADPTATPVADAALAAAALRALREAGYRDVATPQLRRHVALPDILAVQVRARAPGEPAGRDHEIWLDAAGSRVLGSPAPSAPAQLPAPVPAEAP